jgi:hypothetical protein
MNPFDLLFPNYLVLYAVDYGTTWRDLHITCTASGSSAVPGESVPGCMTPGAA